MAWCIIDYLARYWKDKKLVPLLMVTHLPLDKMAAIFADGNFRCNFVNENIQISIKISPKFVPEGPIDNISALV